MCSLKELYKICEISRKYCDEYNIGRVIARPFKGLVGKFERTYDRKDFGMNPPGETLLSYLYKNDFKTYGIGKITDLFGTDYLHDYVHTEGDQNGLDFLIKNIKQNMKFSEFDLQVHVPNKKKLIIKNYLLMRSRDQY